MFKLFKKGKKAHTPSDDQSIEEAVIPENLEVRVMPEKFIGMKPRPAYFKKSTQKRDAARDSLTKFEQPTKQQLKKNIIIGIILIIILGGAMAVAAFLFVRNLGDTETQSQEVSVVTSEPAQSPQITPPPVSSPQAPASPVIPVKPEPPLGREPVIIREDIDHDRDLLTDSEEQLFGTDPLHRDTDRDGFLDGEEIVNLYDPRFGGNLELKDSNSVKTFISNSFNYRLLIPSTWTENRPTGDDSQVRFINKQTLGEYFEVAIEENSLGDMTVSEWFTNQFPGLPIEKTTKAVAQNLEGIITADGLTAHFLTPKYAYTITYNPGKSSIISFITTFRMTIRSFSVFENPIEF